ncbi:hypothetical protein PVAND_017252 [Polypedilum vanderplanki]|uniref:F-box domain-containing protein n=1 Tax=Polypedilum vanderplanki TaxID=319348 RepID=A0A9J6BHR8_POLVA|nr:hypothetical protein PVAND_017252 [Polypedilum vanderplanki]
MKRKWTKCENTINILDFPNEILTKIFKLAENDKNLSLTCMRFYKLISKINEKNVSLYVDYRYLISPFLDLDNFINSSSKVSLTIDKNSSLSNNFDEKLEFFLETFGHKVTKLIICSEIRNFRKIILPKLPNLEELEIHEEIFFDHSKVENFSLHLRKLKINCKIDLKLFEIFTFDELEINLYYFLSKDLKEFFENHENLGKMIIHNNDNINLKKVLKTMKLESLELFATFDQQNVVGNCLRTQTNLKELTLNDVCNEVFTIICDNLKDLEKINFAFTFDTSVEILSKFSNLQKLKSLTINSYLDEKQFQELIKSNLRNLNSLNFSIFFTFSTEDVKNLAENFINLKSFTLTVFSKIHLKVIAKVFEKFDNLEELNLNFANNVQFTKSEVQKFFNQNHKNENLKSLTFDTKPFQIEFLIAKFILDFPNLERLNLGLFEDIKGFFEQILIGFKNLKRIENLKITEKMLETFLRYGQKLENFDIDLNMLEHPNEILKNSSMSLKMWHSLARISRENEMKIELTLMIYAHWKKIRTLMESSKKLKSLTIYFTPKAQILRQSSLRYNEIFRRKSKNFNTSMLYKLTTGNFS